MRIWLNNFIEILLVLEFQLTKFIVGAFSYKAHFRPQISSNAWLCHESWVLLILQDLINTPEMMSLKWLRDINSYS